MNASSTFFDMPLSDGMKQTIKNIGYNEPTPIQQRSIPELLLGNDLLGQAQTGTGKTAAFAIPLIELVDTLSPDIQALVVCPTRELCLQICQEIKRLSAHMGGLHSIAIYGGQAIEQQLRSLKNDKPQIVVATPGRLFDHLRRKSIDLSLVRMIVLDEADEMLDMGFREEIEQILDLLPEDNQRIFFSATVPKAIRDLACSYLRDPQIIKTESESLTATKIAQSYFRVRGKEKIELVCRVLDFRNPKLAVIFCNAKSTADELVEDIKNRGFEAGALHGDLSQNQRDRVMARFKSGSIKVLVATDVAARGIDIDDVELVINFHLPHDPEDYVHRIGRTGRAGKHGRAVSLVEPRDNSRLRRISQFARIEITEEQPPTLAQVKAAKLSDIFGKVKKALQSEKIQEYKSFITKQKLSLEDVAAGMLQLALEKFDDTAQNDEAFAELRGKKYTSYSPDRKSDRSEYRKKGRVSNHYRNGDERRAKRPSGKFKAHAANRSQDTVRNRNQNDSQDGRKNGVRKERFAGNKDARKESPNANARRESSNPRKESSNPRRESPNARGGETSNKGERTSRWDSKTKRSKK